MHYLWSGDLSKSSSQFIMSIFTFFQYFFNRFCLVEKCGVALHCLYRDSLTLRNEYLHFFCSANVGSFISIFCTQHYLVSGEAGVRVKWKSDCNHVFLSRVSDAVVPYCLLPPDFEQLEQYGSLARIGYIGYDLNKLS